MQSTNFEFIDHTLEINSSKLLKNFLKILKGSLHNFIKLQLTKTLFALFIILQGVHKDDSSLRILSKFGFGFGHYNCNQACGQSKHLLATALKYYCQFLCPNSVQANIELYPTSTTTPSTTTTTTTTTAANNPGQNFVNPVFTNRPPALNPSSINNQGFSPVAGAPQAPAFPRPPPAALAPQAPPAGVEEQPGEAGAPAETR